MAVQSKEEYLNLRYNSIQQNRQGFESDWGDIKNYLLPAHGRGLTSQTDNEVDKGDMDRTLIINETAEYSLNIGASGFQAGMTNPALRWFRLDHEDQELAKYPPVREWLDIAAETLASLFDRTNIYDTFFTGYLELMAFGTESFSLTESLSDGLRTRFYTIGEYYLALDSELKTHIWMKDDKLTASQMYERFDSNKFPSDIKDAYDRGDEETRFHVAQLIEPNRTNWDFGVSGFPFRAITFLVGKGSKKGRSSRAPVILKTEGFMEFPAITTRWKTIGNDTYGYGRGHVALGDVKMLQSIEETKLEALHKHVAPPMLSFVEDESISHVPGGVTYSKASNPDHFARPMYQPAPFLQEARVELDAIEMRMARVFYNDFFLMIANSPRQNMTATEVAERHQEKMVMLSPVLTKIFHEKLGPTIRRSFHLMLRLGMMPPPPEELVRYGIDRIKIVYSSMLAQAQKIMGLRAVEQAMGFAVQLSSVKPDVLDIPNTDEIVRNYFRDLGVPERNLNPEELIERIRQERAEAAQRREEAELAKTASETTRNLGGTPVGQDTALDQMIGGIAQGFVQ